MSETEDKLLPGYKMPVNFWCACQSDDAEKCASILSGGKHQSGYRCICACHGDQRGRENEDDEELMVLADHRYGGYSTAIKSEYYRVMRETFGDMPVGPKKPDKKPKKRAREYYEKCPIPIELRWEVWERDEFTCRMCGSRRFLHADHIIPESRGGQTVLENLQTLCKSCNRKKGTKMPEELAS